MFKIKTLQFLVAAIAFVLVLSYVLEAVRTQAASVAGDGREAFVDAPFKPIVAGSAAFVAETFIQSDGKILVAGDFRIINGVTRNGIARFNLDGTLDASFDPGSGANDAVFGIGQQSDGKLIVSGLFTSFNGFTAGRIVRLFPDGQVDQQFNSIEAGLNQNSGATAEVSEVRVLPDDRILIGGSFTTFNGIAQNRLARLNPDGSLDSGFQVGGGANSTVLTIDVQRDGKIVIGGNLTNYNSNPALRIARVNSDGSFDSTFAAGAGADFTVRHVSVQPDGKIYVSGIFQNWGGIGRNGVARLNADGSVDQTFTASGIDATVFSTAVQPDGKVIVGGSFTSISGGVRQCLARLNSDGTLDASFDPGTGIGVNVIQDLALQSDGKVVLVGTFTVYNGVQRGGVARTDANGGLDPSMPVTSSGAGTINTITIQSDSKIIIGGLFTSVNGVARSNVARLNADGSLDPTFDPGTGSSASILSAAVQTDGRILIGGTFTTVNGIARNRIARLNSDGSIDSSFVIGTGAASDVNAILIQPADNRILIGGAFTTFNGTTVNRLARLNIDGSLDTTLATGTSANGTVRSIVLQPDSKILIGGSFSTFNGVARNRIARINSDGVLDSTFNPGTGASNQVSSVALLADGRVVIGGTFTTVNGTARNRIARLNSDGSIDTSFDPGIGPGVGTATDVTQILPVENGRFIVGGNFPTFNNLPRSRYTRLTANGSLDHTFLNGLGASSTTGSGIRSIVRQPDGKLLLGGAFFALNTSARTGIARISNAGDAPVDFDGDGRSDLAVLRRPSSDGQFTWWIKYSGFDGYSARDFGTASRDVPQPGDFDGDGKDDIAVWRNSPQSGESNAYFIVQSASNTIRIVPFGLAGDIAMVDDYDGDGKDDPSVWRAPSFAAGSGQATWFYLGSLNNPRNNITFVPWGMRYGSQPDQVDEPYPGDFDGDGRSDFRIRRRADTGSTDADTPSMFITLTAAGTVSYEQFGLASDRTLPGDYDGDGRTDIAVGRGFNGPGTTNWFIRYTSGIPDSVTLFGTGPNFAQGDYDGDGKTDLGYFIVGTSNETTGFWFVSSQSDSAVFNRWGSLPAGGAGSGDFPAAGYKNR